MLFLSSMPTHALGQTRLRPKANKPSINNMSAQQGGLFGREPSTYGQQITSEPYGVVPHMGGGGLDFLDRVAQAEQRDSERQRSARGRKGHQAFVKRAQDGSLMEAAGGIHFGDDAPTQQQQRQRAHMYQTSNSATNSQMQTMHEEAVQRHHEDTIRKLLMDEHGLSAKEAERELVLWRQEVASGKSAPIPIADEPQGQGGYRPARGENGQFLNASASFEDPFKVRAARSATPPKKKPWEIEDNFKQRSTTLGTPQKTKAWEVDDPFKSRSSPPGANYSDGRTAAAAGAAAAPRHMAAGQGHMGRAHSQFHIDPNASSIAGGIFG